MDKKTKEWIRKVLKFQKRTGNERYEELRRVN